MYGLVTLFTEREKLLSDQVVIAMFHHVLVAPCSLILSYQFGETGSFLAS